MGNLVAIKQALATQLNAALGIPAVPYFPDTVNPPLLAIMSGSPAAKFGVTMGETPAALYAAGQVFGESDIIEGDEYYLVVAAVVTRAMTQRAQEQADALISGARNNGSIANAIMRDTTLDGAVDYAIPVQVSTYGPINWAGVEYFSARVHVQVGA